MKIVFFGTPEFVIPVLEHLCKNFKVIAVVTQPPKPVGRTKILAFSPVDNWAYKRKLNVVKNLADVPSADLGICAAYGQIIPQSVINNFKLGILNIHPSLLPKYRGASPIQAAIAAGDAETGVSIIEMDAEMDHGPIVSSFKEKILETDTTETLTTRLFERSADFLVDLIPSFTEGKIIPKPQDHTKATFTSILKKEDGFIPPEKFKDCLLLPNAYSLDRFIRAMYPWPIAWTYINLGNEKKRLKILKASLVPNASCLVPKTVQLEGKSPVTWKQFQEGHKEAKFTN